MSIETKFGCDLCSAQVEGPWHLFNVDISSDRWRNWPSKERLTRRLSLDCCQACASALGLGDVLQVDGQGNGETPFLLRTLTIAAERARDWKRGLDIVAPDRPGGPAAEPGGDKPWPIPELQPGQMWVSPPMLAAGIDAFHDTDSAFREPSERVAAIFKAMWLAMRASEEVLYRGPDPARPHTLPHELEPPRRLLERGEEGRSPPADPAALFAQNPAEP